MTEQEALKRVQDVASGERLTGHVGSYVLEDDVQAIATLILANRIRMQQLKGELEGLPGVHLVHVDHDLG